MQNNIAKMMVMQMIQNNPRMKNNPMIQNLIGMANRGDMKGVETFVRNFTQENGMNFDEELNNMKSNFKY